MTARVSQPKPPSITTPRRKQGKQPRSEKAAHSRPVEAEVAQDLLPSPTQGSHMTTTSRPNPTTPQRKAKSRPATAATPAPAEASAESVPPEAEEASTTAAPSTEPPEEPEFEFEGESSANIDSSTDSMLSR